MQKKKTFYRELLSNPWSITVVGGVVVVLIQQLFFSGPSPANSTLTNLEVRMSPGDTLAHTKPSAPRASKKAGWNGSENELSGPQSSLPVPDTTVILKTEKSTYDFTIVVHDERWENAKIFADGEWVANAPNAIPLTAGRHHLRVESPFGIYEEIILIPEQSLVSIPK